MPMDQPKSDVRTAPRVKFASHQKPLHSILGAGTVADMLSWKDPRLSAALLAGATAIWFLFEVVEYSFITLLCHLLIFTMAILFVWCHGAGFINLNPPNIHDFELSKSTVNSLFTKLNWFLLKFYQLSSGKDLRLFTVAVASLWILSTIGTYVSSINLLYLGFLCLIILPGLYGRYETEVDYLATKAKQDMRKLYKKLDSRVLNKIPRGPVKEKKFY